MSDRDESYNDSHRAFLQAFMARGDLTLEDAKPILAEIFSVHENRETLPNDITQSDLTQYISIINMAISPFDLEIRSNLHQTSQERVYAIVNTTSDPLTQLATMYSPDEIAYVKRLLDTIFDTNNTRRQEAMVISSMQASQLAKVSAASRNLRDEDTQQQGGTRGNPQSLGLKEAETVVSRLVDEGWFEKSRKGYYTLSPRGLMELRGWLVLTYNDDEEESQPDTHPGARGGKIKSCYACRDIITMGQRCANRHCPVRLHDGCKNNFFRTQQSKKCPVCKEDWTDNNFVGERALTGDRQSHGRARSGAAGSGHPSSVQVGGAEGASDQG